MRVCRNEYTVDLIYIYIYAFSRHFYPKWLTVHSGYTFFLSVCVIQLMALFHCMVRHGTVQYGSFLGGFPLGTVSGTWYFFSTTSAEVPSDPYRYQNVTCKLCWSLIGRRESSLLRHWTCDMRPNIDPLDLNQHSQRRSGRNFCLIHCTFWNIQKFIDNSLYRTRYMNKLVN